MRPVRNRRRFAALAPTAAAILAAGASIGYGSGKIVRGNLGALVPGQIHRATDPSQPQLREGSHAPAPEFGLACTQVPLPVNRIPRRPELRSLVKVLAFAPNPRLLPFSAPNCKHAIYGRAGILVGEREPVRPGLVPATTLGARVSRELDPENGATAGAIRFAPVANERTRFRDRRSGVGFVRIERTG